MGCLLLAMLGIFRSKKTHIRLARDFYWPGMYYDVRTYAQECIECQKYKIVQIGPQGLMTGRVIERPWMVVDVDLMRFPRPDSQNKYLVIFQDLFTKWIELKAIKSAKGKAIATVLEQNKEASELNDNQTTLMELDHQALALPALSPNFGFLEGVGNDWVDSIAPLPSLFEDIVVDSELTTLLECGIELT